MAYSVEAQSPGYLKDLFKECTNGPVWPSDLQLVVSHPTEHFPLSQFSTSSDNHWLTALATPMPNCIILIAARF
ncbi:hypothetical protein ACTXT7_007352 [Hymenolepis weldensis]